MKSITRWALMALLSGLLVSGSACYLEGEGIEKRSQKSFTVTENGTLFLKTDIGAIDVEIGSDDTVVVEVSRKAKTASERRAERIMKDFTLDFRQDGKDVHVTAEYHRGRRLMSWLGNRLHVRFTVRVPRTYNLDLRTSGGGIAVDDLEGRISARTSGGGLRFGAVKGPVVARTSGGTIRMEACGGIAELKTSGGSITLGRVHGDVTASTSGGSIRIEEIMGSIDAHTSGGSIKVAISRQPERNCRLTTSGGTITVSLFGGVKLNLDAKTSGGRVHTDFPVTVRGEISRRMLKAELNGGGPELYLRTSGGSIHIREL